MSLPRRCPLRMARWLVTPIRGWLSNPVRLLRPWVRSGARILDLGCGPGFHAEALARLVGPEGEVVLADVQPQMLEWAAARCRGGSSEPKAKVTPVLVGEGRWPLEGEFDFVLLHWVVHEIADQPALWQTLAAHLRPEASVLVAEPRMHVSGRAFSASMALPAATGLQVERRWGSCMSRWAVLRPTVPDDPSAAPAARTR
jgi:2-polyprenyl-3-methyl-5-hydroxy-6-metoxy-1,4-benzoquinol methylase